MKSRTRSTCGVMLDFFVWFSAPPVPTRGHYHPAAGFGRVWYSQEAWKKQRALFLRAGLP